jgi:hypothetical protein
MCGSPAGQDVGAEEVAPGHLTAVCATFLGHSAAPASYSTQHPRRKRRAALFPSSTHPNLLRVE